MKKISRKNLFFVVFIIVNIVFIFLQIHKQSRFVNLAYEKQRLEKEKDQLIQKKNNLTQEFYQLKNPTSIKDFAKNKLDMKTIKLTQIKKIDSNEQ